MAKHTTSEHGTVTDETAHTGPHSGVSRRVRLLLPAVFLLAGVAVTGCADDPDEPEPDETAATQEQRPEASPTATTVALATLLKDPTAYDDQRVTVRGVADDHGPGIFTLVPAGQAPASPQGTEPGDVEGLVVLHALGDGPDDSAPVQVTGEVNDTFDVAAVERALDVDLDDTLIRNLNLGKDDVVLIADSVRPDQ